MSLGRLDMINNAALQVAVERYLTEHGEALNDYYLDNREQFFQQLNKLKTRIYHESSTPPLYWVLAGAMQAIYESKEALMDTNEYKYYKEFPILEHVAYYKKRRK